MLSGGGSKEGNLQSLALLSLARAFRFCVTVVVALLIGKLVGVFDDASLIKRLTGWQNDAFVSVSGFSPWKLGASYLCEYERARADPEMSGLCPDDPPAYLSMMDRAAARPAPSRASSGNASFLFAAVAVLWHLVARGSAFADLFALLQFASGFLLVIWLRWILGWKNLGAFVVYVLPVLTIAFGCLMGWCTQLVMLTGLRFFGWITHLAGLCCGLAGIASLNYEFALKSMEVKGHDVITKFVFRHLPPFWPK